MSVDARAKKAAYMKVYNKAYGIAYYAANPEKAADHKRKWAKANPEKKAAATKAWNDSNPEKRSAGDVRRRANKLQSIPGWLDAGAVEHIYAKAAEWSSILGVKLHVDHIVPLKSKLVCGLHTHANLQLLAATDNISKGNRHWPEMP